MKINKIVSLLCAVSVTAAATALTPAYAVDSLTIIKYGGSLESIYAEWQNTSSASSYTITCTDANGGVTTADGELIRLYDGYYRVDVPGLKAGTYTLSITDSNGASETVSGIEVKAHTREGFAFSAASPNGGNASGGYNSDGTPASGAVIIYITQDNVNNVQVKIGSKTYTGLQNVLSAIGKDTSGTHYIIRIIGTIDGNKTTFSSGDAAKKHNFEAKNIKNTTIEGIGEDATLTSCAFFIRSCSNFELRNIGEMLFLDDGIAIDGDNSNVWIHNNDIFYGKDLSPATGDGTGDADQYKGDGSLDVKNNSTYCTFSYNHFWDGGKVSLVISSASNFDDTTNYLTYHHNWFDHSDSRHPRLRFASVHVYNNYFDGINGYGSGVTSGASLFAESNYYLDCPRPFASSMQGTDNGTFSKEAGGIIKVYGNAHSGGDNTIYYSASTGSDFDAYKAATRNEQVPSTVTTKLSTFKSNTYNNTYNNFDTAASMYAYQPDSAESVPALVTSYAGRVNGGDISFSFTKSDATDQHRNSKLDSLLLNYTPSVKATLLSSYPATDGTAATPVPQSSAAPTSAPSAAPTTVPNTAPAQTASPLPTAPPVSDLTLQTTSKTWSFEGYDMSSIYDNMRFYYTSDKSIELVDTTYDKTYKKAVNLSGSGKLNTYRSAEVYVAPGSVRINAENIGSADRVMEIFINGVSVKEQAIVKKGATSVTVDVNSDSLIQFLSQNSGIRICSVEYTPSAAPTAAPTASPEPTEAPPVTPTSAPTTAPAETPIETDPPQEEETPAPQELRMTAEKTVDDGVITISIELSEGVEAKLFAAQYDENGVLTAIRLIETDEETLDYAFDFNAENGEAIKIVLWDERMTPFVNKKVFEDG